MSGNKAILDSNVIIDFLSGYEDAVRLISPLEQIFITAVMLGELYVGIYRIDNRAVHLKKLENFLKLCTVLDIDNNTAIRFGQIIASLYKKGKPIPTNDAWIAASALQHHLPLLTNDKHFSHIKGLNLLTNY